MDSFILEHLTSLLALSHNGSQTLKRGENILDESLQNTAHFLITEHDALSADIEKNIKKIKSDYALNDNVKKTQKELDSLQSIYLSTDNDWEDIFKLYSWLGFLEGRTIIEWRITTAALESTENHSLKTLTDEGINFHTNFLDTIERTVQEVVKNQR